MKLSLQKSVNYKTVQDRRKFMIQTEKLHIQDRISYEAFLALHRKYGGSISEVEFAKYFLDISWASYYKLQAGIRDSATVLEREFYEDYEFDDIQNRIIKEEELKIGDKIDYDRLVELHEKYGGRFSLKQFAYEVLNINAHAVGDMISIKGKESMVLRPHAQKRNQIIKMKEDVIENSGLHIGSQITYSEFQELYREYGKYDIDERDFALRVLGITNDVFVRFKSGRRPNTSVFSTFPIDAKKISTLREKVIKKEGLYIEQPISNERFQELYDKYAGILSEELFAEEILDINMEALRQSRRRNENNIILTGIELTEKYVKALQRQIIRENQIQPNNQLMSLGEINELRKKYAPMLTEKRFATVIMGIKYENYIQLAMGTTLRNYVFAIQPEPQIKKIREKVIEEQHLHYDDLIDYPRLHELHQKYAPTMREYSFARDILDIGQTALDNIRNKENAFTHILLDEALPTPKEIEEIRKKLLSKTNVRDSESIDYAKFQWLYYMYGGIMPEDMFSLQVLEITQKELNRIKQNPKFQTRFLMKGKQDWKDGKYKAAKVKKKEPDEKEPAKKRGRAKSEESIKREKKDLEEKAIKVISECLDTPSAILSVKKYIEQCEEAFEDGELRPDQLKSFADAIIYVEAERKHIEVFAKACVDFEEYDFCSRHISRNLEGNENLSYDDRIKLRELQNNIRYALRKQRAVNMIARGVTDVNRIMYATGALEVDILAIMNRMRSEKTKTEVTSQEGNGGR